MLFSQILSINNIRQGVICSSKKKILEQISSIIAKQMEIKEQVCFDCLVAREKLGCTSLGQGVAMPHAKLPVGDKPTAVFLQLKDPINYDSSDKREIDLIFALLLPQNCCGNSLSLLSELAEKLTDKGLCRQLRSANNTDEILEAFETLDQQFLLKNAPESINIVNSKTVEIDIQEKVD